MRNSKEGTVGILADHLLMEVIRPTNRALQLWTQAADELVLGTACQESGCGRYLVQLGGGPALGIFQMEPATFNDHHAWLRHRPLLKARVAALTQDVNDAHEMVWNLRFAAAMCRIHYYRRREPLPTAGNIAGQAQYWKQYYNTYQGAGTVQQYVDSWARHTR